MNSNDLRCSTIKDFIEALGGERAVADEFGLCTQAIIQWRIRNHISSGFHIRLLALAHRRGISVDPSVFGFEESEVGELFHLEPQRKLRVA